MRAVSRSSGLLLALALALAPMLPASATHDLELVAEGDGTNGWVAIRFYTDGAENDPEPIVGFLNEAGQIGLQVTLAASSTDGYIHAGAFGPLLNVDGTFHHGPVVVEMQGWDGGQVGLRAHGPDEPALVDYSFDPVNGDQAWGGEGRVTYYHYPPKAGEYTAFMFVAGDVTRWRWRFFARPHNNVRVVNVTSGEGSTHLLDGPRFEGVSAAADLGNESPAVRAGNRATIHAEYRLLGISLAPNTVTELRADAPNGSFDCRSCWFSRAFEPGPTTFHLTGVLRQDRFDPLVAYADVDLP